jgi:hypothetical protein
MLVDADGARRRQAVVEALELVIAEPLRDEDVGVVEDAVPLAFRVDDQDRGLLAPVAVADPIADLKDQDAFRLAG